MKTYCLLFIVLLAIIMLGQCSDSISDKKKNSTIKNRSSDIPIHFSALPKTIKSTNNNGLNADKINLGKLLFYDPILSGDKDVACATCHHPNNGYTEYRDLSIGVNGQGLGSKRHFIEPNKIPFVKRNAQTVLNTAFNGILESGKYNPEDAPMFWDLRASSLEEQAIIPILAFEEMRGLHFSESEILDEIIHRLERIPAYVLLFEKVFKGPKPINEENIGKAIAAFERTLISAETRFDKYMGGDEHAISLSEKDGFEIFRDVGCANCHKGPMFSDFEPHVLGVPTNPKLSEFDTGIDEAYAFRTPSLRNLQLTAPYMHNGVFTTLKEVLEFYEDAKNGKRRHEEVAYEQVDTLIRDLKISVKEIGPIISFLNTLNDSDFDKTIPERVPSGLQVGGNIN